MAMIGMVFASGYSARGIQQPKESKEEEHGLEGRHFLVAEDNDINAEILIELLSRPRPALSGESV